MPREIYRNGCIFTNRYTYLENDRYRNIHDVVAYNIKRILCTNMTRQNRALVLVQLIIYISVLKIPEIPTRDAPEP
jgi:hypothetical protein